MPSPFRRRRTLTVAALAASALALASCASADAEEPPSGDAEISGEIVWADWGGSTNESINTVFLEPFGEEYGVEVVSTMLADAVQNAMFAGDEGEYDAMMTGMAEVVLYEDNLLAMPDDVPRGDLVPAEARDYAIMNSFVGYAMGYLPETFEGTQPESWADFWDVETFPGKRAIPGEYHDYMFEAALLADGVAPDELYPLDLDRALAKLDELKPYAVYYTEYPQIQQLLSSGGAAIAFGPTGQYAGLANAGVDVSVSWNGGFVEANPFVVASGAPNPEAVWELARFIADPERQAELARLTTYGPASSEAFEYMTEEEIERLPNAPSHTEAITPDATDRAENYQLLADTYTGWLAG